MFEIRMVNWQVTATTIHCEAVDDEVTLMVYKDWSAKCTGFQKYTESRDEQINLVRKSLKLRRPLECEGNQCTRLVEYRQQLQDEEAMKQRAIPSPTTDNSEAETVTDEQ